MFQDRLGLTAAREERRRDVAGPEGAVRTRAERGQERALVTVFGQVTVSRSDSHQFRFGGEQV